MIAVVVNGYVCQGTVYFPGHYDDIDQVDDHTISDQSYNQNPELLPAVTTNDS